MRPIKVLDLRDTYEIGGPGKTILETFRAIDAARFELHLGVFLTRQEATASPFIEAARRIEMPVHSIVGFNQYDPRLIHQTAALVQRLGIDIVHAHEVKSDAIAYLATFLHRVPIVTTLHGWIGNSTKQRALIAVDRKLVRRFDLVIAVSSQIRNELLESGVPPDRIRLVQNAIVLENYQAKRERGFVAELAGRPINHPIIASIGRLSAEKGHADLIDALGIVARRGRQFFAVLAGDGPERQRLIQRIGDLGLSNQVLLPGYVDRPQRVLADTDLMVLPSHTEGLPNAALEALVMDVAVLATSVGGTPEVITDGETGRLVPARNPQALADQIEDFLLDSTAWKQMATRGRTMVERCFDFRSRTRTIETIYAELAEARAS